MSTLQAAMKNDMQSIARARDLIIDLARIHNMSADVVSHMSIALDEALSNIVKYGYADDRVHEIQCDYCPKDYAISPAQLRTFLTPS